MNPKRIAAAAVIASALAFGSAAAQVPSICHRHLTVELTPDVPNPRDLAFLSSLLTQPGFQLAWTGQNGSAVELELSGPGPDDQCRAVIAGMRKDSRVQSITVTRD
jgi:ABC-type sulfate transport system substrate-binding protein